MFERSVDGYNNVTCAEGYTGALCGSCAEGYGRSGEWGCNKCPAQSANNGRLFAAVVGITIAFAVFTWCAPRAAIACRQCLTPVGQAYHGGPCQCATDTHTHVLSRT
jgi:hypothetical protein